MRYCLSAPTDLALLAGLPRPETDEAVQCVLLHVEDELVAMTTALLELDERPEPVTASSPEPNRKEERDGTARL
jgi:hypothetical protein